MMATPLTLRIGRRRRRPNGEPSGQGSTVRISMTL